MVVRDAVAADATDRSPSRPIDSNFKSPSVFFNVRELIFTQCSHSPTRTDPHTLLTARRLVQASGFHYGSFWSPALCHNKLGASPDHSTGRGYRAPTTRGVPHGSERATTRCASPSRCVSDARAPSTPMSSLQRHFAAQTPPLQRAAAYDAHTLHTQVSWILAMCVSVFRWGGRTQLLWNQRLHLLHSSSCRSVWCS